MCPGLETTIVRMYSSKDGLPWGMDVIGDPRLWLVTPDLIAHDPVKKRL